MKLLRPICPECGELARGSVEVLHGCAELDIDENGAAEYAGSTDIWWDEQRSEEEDGVLRLICPSAHEWTTEYEDND